MLGSPGATAWFLLACAGAPSVGVGADSGVGGADEGAEDSGQSWTTSPGWTLGTPTACDDPVGFTGWRDASDELGVTALEPATPTTSISVAHVGDSTWIATAAVPDRIQWWSLPDGASTVRTRSEAPLRVSLVDLDADGAMDLLAWGDRMHVAWSLGADDETWEELWGPPDSCIGVQEALTFDADGDGDLDVLLTTSPGCDPEVGPTLFRQEGPRQLVEQPGARGGPWGVTFAAVLLDWDADGDPDVYLCNDRGPKTAGNTVLLNDGSGAFSRGDAEGADLTTFCMSASAGDLDGDGRLDLHLTATDRQHALLAGSSGFVDHASAWGLGDYDGIRMPWGNAVADVDNDGDADLLVATSEFSGPDTVPRPLELWQNQGAAGWQEQGQALGLPTQAGTRAVLPTDLDGDGLLDLVVSDYTRTPWLFRSKGCTAAGWLEVAAPDGTLVQVEAGGHVQVALVSRHPGMAATGPAIAHVGLGEQAQVDLVRAWVPWHGEVVLAGPIQARQRVSWAP